MSGLRILYVDTDRVWRGGQEQLFDLMEGMLVRGHRVSLAAPPEAPLTERALLRGIEAFPFRQRTELSLLALARLYRVLKPRRFDVVHFNTPRCILAGGLAARLAGIPVRVCSRRVNFPLRSQLSRFKYSAMLEAVITVSVSIRDTLVEAGLSPERVRVVYEGVDLAWIDGQKMEPEWSGLDRLVVGTVAYLSPEKGHSTLVEAAARLVPEFPQLLLVLVGEGELRPQLVEQARRLGLEERVVFTGFRGDAEALMKEFDVFCLPSLSEGLSSAILAAMAGRLPVVATTAGGIPELVVDGQTGFLVPPQEPEPLYEALRRLLSSRELRRRMGEAGRRRIEDLFTLERKLDASEALYWELLRPRGIG